MGNTASINNTVTTILENITNTTLTSMKNATTTLDQSQSISVDCSDERKYFTMMYNTCINNCNSSSNSDKMECAKIVCSPLSPSNVVCEVEDVTMENTLDLTMNDTQKSNLQSTLTNVVKESIKNTLDQTGSPIPFSDTKLNNKLDNVTRIITTTIIEAIDVMSTSMKQNQSIELKSGGSIKRISFATTKKILTNRLQDSTVVNTQLNNLIKEIDNSVTQVGGQSFGLILLIIFIVMIVLMFVFGIISMFTSSSSEEKSPSSSGENPSSKEKPLPKKQDIPPLNFNKNKEIKRSRVQPDVQPDSD